MKKEITTIEYCAGFIDGEGYIGILKAKYKWKGIDYGYRYFIPVISVGSTYKPIIEVLNKTLKESVEKQQVYNKFGNRKLAYRWVQKGNKSVKKVLDLVKSDLIIKKELANLVYKCCITKSKKEKEKLYLKCRKLNKRGLAETE